MALNYLLDPMFQIENSAGKPATDGWLEVYIHGTREKYYCASNFDGTLHPFKIKLDSLGSNIVLADDSQSYDVYAYNRFGSLLMSRYNVQPGSGGSGSGGDVGTMQHWMGMYGPTYTNFPGDLAGHTLGIPKNEIEYVGDFIDHISTAPYPDGDVPAYIYLKPGLYHIDCVIRYQQSNEDVKNTLDEVLVYTGHGNANEDVAYQLDASGPETNGNRHCLKQSFIRKVTEEGGGLLYFAPGTPTDWKDAYIQTLSIVKLDSIALSPTIVQGLEKVTHDATMTGDGTVMNPLSIQDSLDGKQDTLTPGEGINLDSDGNISVDPDDLPTEPVDFSPIVAGHGITIEDSDGETVISATGEVYSAGYGILIDSDNEISVDPDTIQQKLTEGNGIQIDSDGTISADLPEEEEVEFEELNLDDYQKKLTAGEGIILDSDGVISVDSDSIPSEPVDFTPLVAGANISIEDSDGATVISANVRVYTAGENIEIDSDGVISATGLQKELTADYGIDLDSDGNIGVDPNIIPELPPILPLVAGENVTLEDSDGVVVISADGGGSTYSAGQGINIVNDVISVDSDSVAMKSDLPSEEEVNFEELDLDDYQKKLTAGQNIEIDSDGVISATGGEPCLWFLDSNGLVQPKDGKQFEVYGAPSYSTVYDYYYAMFNRMQSTNGGFEVDHMLAQHRGADTTWGNPSIQAIVKTVFSSYPYMGAAQAGLTVLRGTDGSGQESRVDLRAGSPSTYTEQAQVESTYVQAYRKGNYIRVRSDDIIHHVGNVNGHAPFVLVQQSDTSKKYVLQPTATAGIYELVEETSGGAYSAGENIDIDSDGVISAPDVQKKLTAGEGINIDSDGVISVKVGFISL